MTRRTFNSPVSPLGRRRGHVSGLLLILAIGTLASGGLIVVVGGPIAGCGSSGRPVHAPEPPVVAQPAPASVTRAIP